jgi:hypothetical protein
MVILSATLYREHPMFSDPIGSPYLSHCEQFLDHCLYRFCGLKPNEILGVVWPHGVGWGGRSRCINCGSLTLRIPAGKRRVLISAWPVLQVWLYRVRPLRIVSNFNASRSTASVSGELGLLLNLAALELFKRTCAYVHCHA